MGATSYPYYFDDDSVEFFDSSELTGYMKLNPNLELIHDGKKRRLSGPISLTKNEFRKLQSPTSVLQ